MKTITIDEFETLIARDDWQHEQGYEIVERLSRHVEEWDEETQSINQIDVPYAWGWASKTSRLDEIEIIYNEGFSYDEYNPGSVKSSTEGWDEIWIVRGVTVIDDDEILSARELGDYLESNFSDIDYSEFKANLQKD